MTPSSRIPTLSVVLALCLLLPLTANGHKVRIFAWAEGTVIHGETAFSGSRKPNKATITVQDSATKETLLTTETDTRGVFSFQLPEKAVNERLDLLLIVNSGEGHRGEWPLPAAEYLESPLPSPPGQKTQPASAAQSPPIAAPAAGTVPQQLDEQLLRRIIDEELEKKMATFRQMLAENSDAGPDLRDILGGIGYIIGIAGLLAWVQSKKKRRGNNR